ncbi:LysM domain-containing protein [Variovorax sp. E3]|uniref:LysM peptidoglycan-binding domain-containing protein n=1 Tax=Variovorax sp. E3 TaxID=1914993 RepID=UPI0018DE54AD|nr:LysM domain-containing protein [Variovorax sp. E3]
MWEDGIDKADDAWDAYDCELRAAVGEYNRHLASSPGFVPLDWKVVKAMLWVETGAKNPKWRTRPMQIGNEGDPGLQSLLLGNEGGDLVVPPSMRPYLSIESARQQPAQNIRAGIGYLLMRMANFAFKSVPGPDARVLEITAAPGDSLDRIAKAQGSTLEVMKKLNPSVGVVHAGDVLKYQKASIQRVITGWNPLSAGSIAQRYNSGDSRYASKLQHAARVLGARAEAACAR